MANSTTIPADRAERIENTITDLADTVLKLGRKIDQLCTQPYRTCDHDCVLCAMIWFCVEKKGMGNEEVCGRYLEKVILAYALKIENIDIKKYPCYLKHTIQCDGLVNLLTVCEITNLYVLYEYPLEANGKNEKIDEAWSQLVTIDCDENCVMLGRLPNPAVPGHKKEGHIEVCNLEKAAFGWVTIYDPQNRSKLGGGIEYDQEGFRKYVMNDGGLHIYTVKWKKVEEIIEWHREITVSDCEHDAR